MASGSSSDELQMIKDDIYLKPFASKLHERNVRFQQRLREIEKAEGSLDNFSMSYQKFGLHVIDGGIEYREWAPGAKQVNLTGDFNKWNRDLDKCTRDEYGVWVCFIPNLPDGSPAIEHGSRVKAHIVTASGEHVDRIPAWIPYAVQEPDTQFCGRFWNPPEKYQWKHTKPDRVTQPRIYEAHVGMATEHPKVGTYKEFEETVLPRIHKLGYNVVQIMAVMEHAYYASFGYHVTNFFAVSSRCGTPEEFKSLVDAAHKLGIAVLIDIVHSHASKNVLDGINMFDGTDHQYFHGGPQGNHELWDSRCFNYGHWEVQRFLLSNLRWWLNEYQVDGFRFDGITSMLYKHHGMGTSFVSYDQYFDSSQVDEEAIQYMMLVHHMLKTLHPYALSIAEDVSGMPGLCRDVSDGGIGFHYRLGMAIPDMWIKLLKEMKDDDWNMGWIVHELTNRRWKEKTIAYCESHDQALVGDKTIAFWLMDKEMYDHMSVLQPYTPIVARGIALHKMIRLLTYGLGGEGYLNFMGNEFGHPEWIDFPRAGNGNSYHYARRRWDLASADHLRYKHLDRFDGAMHRLESTYHWLTAQDMYVSLKHEDDKVVAFERGGLIWVFNFHHTKSFEGYQIGVNPCDGKGEEPYVIALNTDHAYFGGFSTVDAASEYPVRAEPWHGRSHSVQVYIPSRTALVLSPKSRKSDIMAALESAFGRDHA